MISRKHGNLVLRKEPAPETAAQLEREGFVHIPGVLDPEATAALRDEIAAVFETTPPDRERDTRGEWRYAMFNRSPLAQKAVASRAILDALEPLLGEDCHIIANTAWRNPAGHQGGRWHIDAGPHVPRPAGVPWPDGLNFNGIVLAPDTRHLIAGQTNLGRFWRITLDGGDVDEVELEGGPLGHCDGLAIEGSTLYTAINALGEIAVIELAVDGSSGRVRRRLRSEAFAFPTAVAISAGRLLVVNAQLDKMGAAPDLPFTVAAVATEA